MVHLVSVNDEFHARVIAARLGSDGILTELRSPLGSPYPMLGEVHVYVEDADLSLARELLSTGEDSPPLESQVATDEAGPPGLRAPKWGPWLLLSVLLLLVVVVTLT